MPERLAPGMKIRTNYSGPYIVERVLRGCTCAACIDEMNGRGVPSAPHVHLVCTAPDRPGQRYYLNRWDENSLRSLDETFCGGKTSLTPDWIEILDVGFALPLAAALGPLQMELAL